MNDLKRCFRDPIPEIYEAAELLRNALDFHLQGDHSAASNLIEKANFKEIWQWTDSIWGAKSKYVNIYDIPNSPPKLKKHERVETRMPSSQLKAQLIERDGYICVFCGIPLIRTETRKEFIRQYPEAIQWGRKNIEQHAAFQAMWLQYDHLAPHSRGGDNNIDNIVITCAPCNFGRMENTIDEVGLKNPMERGRIKMNWSGLEEIHSI